MAVRHRGPKKGFGFALEENKNTFGKWNFPHKTAFQPPRVLLSFPKRRQTRSRSQPCQFSCSQAGGPGPPDISIQAVSHFSINSYFTGFALPTSLVFISHLLTPLLLSRAPLESMTAIHIPFYPTFADACSLDIFSHACLKAALKP